MEQALLSYKYAFVGQFFIGVSFIGYLWACFVAQTRINFLKISSSLLALSYLILTYCFAVSDFSIKSVLENSALNTPLIYKIVGVWGCSSGSFLLWLVFLSLTGWILNSALSKRLFSFHLVSLMALQYIALPPFETVSSVTQNYDLTPALQDHSMVFHPPILYLGQVFWAYIFFRNFDADFQQDNKKRFVMVGCGFFILTLGILLGSYWAYYSLGWGGYWAWDPVEVVSLWGWVLYLFAFHLLHKKKQENFLFFIAWPIILFGVALVRSGVLASVHSFAQNQYFIIPFIIVFASFIWLSILCVKKKKLLPLKNLLNFDRLHSIWPFYFICFFTVLFVLIFTVVLPVFNEGIFFSDSFYTTSLTSISLPILVLMSLKPYYFYLRIKPYGITLFLLFILVFCLFLEDESFALLSVLTLALCSVGIFCCVLNVFYVKAIALSARVGMFFGHIGWFIFITSAIFVNNKSTEEVLKFNIDSLKNEKKILSSGYQVSIVSINQCEDKNFSGLNVNVLIRCLEGKTFNLDTTLKNFTNIDVTKAEMGIARDGFSEHMVVVDKFKESTLFISYYKKTGIAGVWLGSLFVLFGTFLFIWKQKKYHE